MILQDAIGSASITIQKVHEIISTGESETLELKKSLTQLKPALETLCAFLNTSGGVILIGVSHVGKVVGQVITDNTQQEIANEIAKIEPFPASLDILYLPLCDNASKSVVYISVTRGSTVPYTYDNRAYYRNQSSTMRMPQTRYAQLLLERGIESQSSWETQLVKGGVAGLDFDEIMRTIKVAVNINRMDSEALNESIEDVLMRLELLKRGRISNAAMVLFSKSPGYVLPQCSIKMARFKGVTELTSFVDNQMVTGNVFHILKVANEFIMRHLSLASFFDNLRLERIDKPMLPVLAIREAICNAICHRDYSINNAVITLAIFEDRMEIWNNGTLPSSLNLEDLKKRHKSYPRNKVIAKVLYLRGYVETWGTGTTKMIKLCREHGIPDPIFDEYSGGFSVIFAFHNSSTANVVCAGEARLNVLTNRQEELYGILKKHKAIGMSDILLLLKAPPSDRMVRKDLDALRKRKLVSLHGYGKSSKWVIND